MDSGSAILVSVVSITRYAGRNIAYTVMSIWDTVAVPKVTFLTEQTRMAAIRFAHLVTTSVLLALTACGGAGDFDISDAPKTADSAEVKNADAGSAKLDEWTPAYVDTANASGTTQTQPSESASKPSVAAETTSTALVAAAVTGIALGAAEGMGAAVGAAALPPLPLGDGVPKDVQ